VSIENIHHADHLTELTSLVELSMPVIQLLDGILKSGWDAGVFRTDVDAVDVHMMISSYCFFRVANRHSFGALFGRDLVDPGVRDHYRGMLGDMIVSYLTAR
jgi:hypothetical protein